VWSVAIVGGGGLLFLVLFGLWMFRHPEPLNERRIRSWTLYGQFLLSALLMVLVCLLMIPRTISAEAGLAVLAAIAGFAAGRTVAAPSGRSRRRRDRPRVPRTMAGVPTPDGDAPPPPVRELEPIVTARYPRNRRS
jgi:hypothetical protein